MTSFGFQLEVFIDDMHPHNVTGTVDEPLGVKHMALKIDDLFFTLEQLKGGGINTVGSEIGTDWTGVKCCYINRS